MKLSYLLRIGGLALSAGFFLTPGWSQAAASPSANVATPNGAQPAQKVDLNTADIPTLEAVPEIGTDLANAVVAGRPYKSVDDFARVLRLSPEKMTTLRAKVWVSPAKISAAPATTTPRTGGPSKPPPTNEGKATAAKDVTERYDRGQAKKTEPQKK
jgi:hypothetical protein